MTAFKQILISMMVAVVGILCFASLRMSTLSISLPASMHSLPPLLVEDSSNKSGAVIIAPSSRYKFAGIFLVAGCDPATHSYRGFLYNTIAAAYMLRESIMDLHLMVRMAASTQTERLPKEDEDLLHKANITLRYLPKAKDDTFFTAMMDKFIVLEYEEYDRILFMDADVLPLCNLDYLLVHSMTGRLKPNVVIEWQEEPASGGFFILQPGKKKRLDEIVEARRKRQINKTEFFDSYLGWGQPIYHEWRTARDRTGADWTFYGAYADQGLLYHWTLYEQQHVSVIEPDHILQYEPGPEGRSVLKEKVPNFLESCVPHPWKRLNRRMKATPYLDFVHYSGWKKPWVNYSAVTTKVTSDPLEAKSLEDLWYSILGQVELNWKMHFQIDAGTAAKAPLGKGPARKELDKQHRGIFPNPNRRWARKK